MALRTAMVLGLSALAGLPLAAFRPEEPAAQGPTTASLAVSTPLDASAPAAERWADSERTVAIQAPAGWTRSPDTSLNPISDPPDPVFELARFQLRVGDPELYAQPVPLTSGLVADAKALLSIGLAREKSELAGMDPDARGDRVSIATVPGFVYLDEDASFEGTRTYTRYFFARASDRVVVARAVAAESDWPALAPAIMAALGSVRADPHGPNGPLAVLRPPPPEPALAVAGAPAGEASEPVDTTIEIRADILARAHLLLGVSYVWGGNSTTRGMDCSAYVSRAWGVDRHTTESIWQVASAIAKSDLRPGDALNLTIGRDPQRLGHIRIFEAWANAEHSIMWVFEETPPRAVHRVIVYDDRYQPIRLAGLSAAGIAHLIPERAPDTPPDAAADGPRVGWRAGLAAAEADRARGADAGARAARPQLAPRRPRILRAK